MSKIPLSEDMIDAMAIGYALDNAAQALALSDGANWGGWLRYFLESLEHRAAGNQAYQILLKDLQRDITVRLEQGHW